MMLLKKSHIILLGLVTLLVPIEYNWNQVNVSVNYSFAIIFIMISMGRIRNVAISTKLIWVYFVFSLFYGILTAILINKNPAEAVAGIIFSWILVTSPFTILFFNYNLIIDDFKRSIKIVSFAYSVIALIILVKTQFLNGIYFPQMIKASMTEYMPGWPDRFTPILVLSLLISTENKNDAGSKTVDIYESICKFLNFFIVGLALIFTFSRAIYLGLIFVMILKISRQILKYNYNYAVLAKIILAIGVLIAVVEFNDFAREVYENISEFILKSVDELPDSMGDANSSAGARLERLEFISDIITHAPFGHGGLGINNINTNYGSAESQYLDYLIRFGLPGLVILLFVHVKAYLISKNNALLQGFNEYVVFLIVFGIFHETIRLPYIAISLLIVIALESKIKNEKK